MGTEPILPANIYRYKSGSAGFLLIEKWIVKAVHWGNGGEVEENKDVCLFQGGEIFIFIAIN